MMNSFTIEFDLQSLTYFFTNSDQQNGHEKVVCFCWDIVSEIDDLKNKCTLLILREKLNLQQLKPDTGFLMFLEQN